MNSEIAARFFPVRCFATHHCHFQLCTGWKSGMTSKGRIQRKWPAQPQCV